MYEKYILFFGDNSTDIDDSSVDIASSSDSSEVYEVDYSDSTDSHLYTVTVQNDQPLTVAEQSTVYLLEIRNILLIFLLSWLLLSFYSKIKNTFVNYFGKE